MNTEMTPHQPDLVPQDDRTFAMLAHVLGIFTSFIGALILWLVNKDNPQKRFVTDQAKEALNFQITIIIAGFVCGALMIVFIGFFLFLVLWVLMIVFPIIAGVKSYNGERYRYPMILRLIS